MKDVFDILDLHTHTIASGHAYNTLYEMAQAAADHQVQLLGCSDHGPKLPGASHPFHFINFKVIPRQLYGVSILMGCEMNILDCKGTLDLEQRFCRDLDYALAGIHEPCYAGGTVSQNTAAYVNAIKNPRINIISHPDDGRFPYDAETVAAAAAEHHTLLEINNSSLDPRSARQNAHANYLILLEQCRRFKTSVVLNSDAHVAVDVGNHRMAWDLIHEIDFPRELIVNSCAERLAAYIPRVREVI